MTRALLLVGLAAIGCAPAANADGADGDSDLGDPVGSGADAAGLGDTSPAGDDAIAGDALSPGDATLDETSFASCTNGDDEDQDGWTDCQDQDCWVLGPCDSHENSSAECTDTYDNDGDGYVDCVDFGCAWHTSCGTPENTDALCSDGDDDDGDELADCDDPQCLGTTPCPVTRVRVATFNVQTIGAVDTEDYTFLRDILRRVGPDVVCLQEVEEWETSRLAKLADDVGLGEVFQGEARAIAGGLTNACLSRWPYAEVHSYNSADLSPDADALEMSRDLVLARVVVPGGDTLAIFATHLKSGFDDGDAFRRQLEAQRVGQALAAHAIAQPGEPRVLLGDFNEDIAEGNEGEVFNAVPAGMPFSFALGSDVTFPVTYDPFGTFAAAGLALTDPTHEDSTTEHATRIPSGRRIDYIAFSDLTLLGDEVYERCLDNGVDDAPAGQWLEKVGDPLPCELRLIPSDHRLVFADFAW